MPGFFDRLFKVDQKHLKKLTLLSEEVLKYEEEIRKLTDEELKAKTVYFRELLASGKTLEDIRSEAYAVAREAAKRVLNQFPYQVQVIGALVLDAGDIAEMRTGEGKTLTATMAVYLNALEGKGVHVVTVNEYLAGRDAEWMGEIYRFLGLTVGVNKSGLTAEEKKKAFACDITYTTSQEIGFDYLRDNMVTDLNKRVLRELNYAVIDEADSILIDEARTPLIISGGQKNTAKLYIEADRFVKSLKSSYFVSKDINGDDIFDEKGQPMEMEVSDYDVDLEDRKAILTEWGIKKAEQRFNIPNLYTTETTYLVHLINQALQANLIMQNEVEYVVQDDEIKIVDQFTGRILEGRQYNNGLHQAIQAKEGVKIKEELATLATVTLQNFFRLYNKLAGMTGTAKTEEEEFLKVYNMRVVAIPPNKPVIRVDATDLIYANKNYKYKALIEEIKEKHSKGQPVLVGTISVDVSEVLSKMLQREGIRHEVLNAKNHAREAEIIAKAGKKGAVTIATNMAGRGTDIKIDEEVRELGGLAVLGSERHESRRIDNQLRGRSGRQGDVGYSRFYVSFEDDLLVRTGTNKNGLLMKIVNSMGDQPIESKMIAKAIESAQGRIEGYNFDSRKSTLEYDDVLRQQRETMYAQRDEVLKTEDPNDIVLKMINRYAHQAINRSYDMVDGEEVFNFEKLKLQIDALTAERLLLNPDNYVSSNVEELIENLHQDLVSFITNNFEEVPAEIVKDYYKKTLIHIIDANWQRHIDDMDKLRNAIRFRGKANINPLNEYINDGFEMFQEMMNRIADILINNIMRVKFQRIEVPVNRELQAKKKKLAL
ncbi:MAG: preprotein translocase subunit SecA [Erysipelotrichaceae bacterium]|nr:preprotein translocase subunit SecA [Erysipelotrichaceae bacterium]